MRKEQASVLDTLIAIMTEAAGSDRVILFGSRATSRARTESDYDFLVIVPNVENEHEDRF